MSVEIKSSKQLETQAGIKFDTYRFYLECFCDYLTIQYTDLPGFIAHCSSATKSIRWLPQLNISKIECFLKIAWNTEYLIHLDMGDPEITRINNQWAPIQAYYSVYSASEALAYAFDGSEAYSHQKALSKSSAFLIKLGISPWDKAFRGSLGRKGTAHMPVNFPKGSVAAHNLQRISVEPIDMVYTCLRAEHKNRVGDKWNSKNRTGVYKYQFDPGYTTLLHFLYRLRIKSNYQELDLFITDAPTHHIISFADSLRVLTSWTLALIEVILMRRFGRNPIIKLANTYIAQNPKDSSLRCRIIYYSS